MVERGDVVELAAVGGSVAAGEAAVAVAEPDGCGGQGVGSVDQGSVGQWVACDGFAEGGVGGDGGFESGGEGGVAEVDARGCAACCSSRSVVEQGCGGEVEGRAVPCTPADGGVGAEQGCRGNQ